MVSNNGIFGIVMGSIFVGCSYMAYYYDSWSPNENSDTKIGGKKSSKKAQTRRSRIKKGV